MITKWYQHAARLARPLMMAACLPSFLLPTTTVAESFRLLHDGDSVIGSAFYVKTRQQDTLLDIGRHNGLGYDDMNEANPGIDMWVPGADKEVLVPTRYVLPDAPHQGLVLNLAEKRLYYFPENAKGVHFLSVFSRHNKIPSIGANKNGSGGKLKQEPGRNVEPGL